MKTLLITLLISLSFSSFSFAGDLTSMALAPELKQLSSEATQYMSDVYTDSMGESIEVQTKSGLEQLKVDLARDVLEGAFEINSSDSLENYIHEANALTSLTAPVFQRSKCCGCGECTNF